MLSVANSCCGRIFLVGVYWVTLWEELKTQLLWTKKEKMFSELTKFGQQFTFKRHWGTQKFTIEFSHKVVFLFQYRCKLWFPRERQPWDLRPPVTHHEGQGARYVDVTTPLPHPSPRSRRVYPPTSDWCRLHSLDPIAVLLQENFYKTTDFHTVAIFCRSPPSEAEVSKCDQSRKTWCRQRSAPPAVPSVADGISRRFTNTCQLRLPSGSSPAHL